MTILGVIKKRWAELVAGIWREDSRKREPASHSAAAPREHGTRKIESTRGKAYENALNLTPGPGSAKRVADPDELTDEDLELVVGGGSQGALMIDYCS